jgi:hypothetical protein
MFCVTQLNEEFALCSELEYAKLLKLNPDGGGVATREVITWATNDIVSQTKNIARPQRALKSLSTDALQARAEAARGVELKETIVRRTNLKPPNSTMYCIVLWPTGAGCSLSGVDVVSLKNRRGQSFFACPRTATQPSLTIWFVCVFQIDLILAQQMPGKKNVFHLAEQLSSLEIGELRARARCDFC